MWVPGGSFLCGGGRTVWWPVPGGSLSTRQSWVLEACGLCGLCGLTVGCGPSALRWMAAKAEFVGV